MTEPPDWVTSTPSTPGVHPSGTEDTAFTRPDFLLKLPNFIAQLVEKLLGAVVQALAGIFIPGGFGSAFTQLQAWGARILGLIPALIKLFTDILTFNWAAIPGDLADLAGLGVDATSVSTALSQSVTSAPSVTHDAHSHGEVHTGNPTSFTLAHPTSVAANPAMTVYVAIGPLTPTAYAKGFVTVTYNGVALKSEIGVDTGHGTNGWLELFTLEKPAANLHDVVVTADAPVHSIIVDVDTYVACGGFSGAVSAATNAERQALTVRGGTGGMVSVGAAAAAPIAALSGATQRSLQNVDTTTAAGNLIVGDAPGADSVTVTATR